MNEENEFRVKDLSEEDYDEQYNGGYYNHLARERTQRLMDCWGKPHPYNTEKHRKLRESMKGPFMEDLKWFNGAA